METLDPGAPDALADAVARQFEQDLGRPPFGVFAAPGRVNLIGEHVDYNGGLCLPMALPHATYAAVGVRDDDTISLRSNQSADEHVGSLDDFGPGRATGWAAYAGGVLWALREDGWDVPGLDVLVDSRVPVGAGLSSSAALECAVAVAVAEVTGDDPRRRGAGPAGEGLHARRAGGRRRPDGRHGPDHRPVRTVRVGPAARLPRLVDAPGDVGPGVRRAGAARRGHAGVALLGGRRLRSRRREDCEKAAALLGVRLLRDVDDQAKALDALEDERVRRRVRARVHGDRAGPRGGP